MVGFWIVLGKGFGFWGNGRRTMGYFGVFVLWEDGGKGVSNARWDKFWCDRYSTCFLLIMYEKNFFFFWVVSQFGKSSLFKCSWFWYFSREEVTISSFYTPPPPKKEKEIEHYIKIWLHYIYILVFIAFMSFQI